MRETDPPTISKQLHAKLQRILSALSAPLVLALCLFLTVVSAFLTHRALQSEQQVRFTRVADIILDAIQSRLRVYENLLLATQGMFYSQERVTREEFHKFITQLNIGERFPGIQAIGYTERIPRSQLAAHERAMRRQGFTEYKVWPKLPVREDYFSIVYIEPFDWRNKRAFGYDMFAEEARRAAMEKARDTGLPQATSKVILVQETKNGTQNGFLIYVPYYDPAQKIDTMEDRRKALRGYIYAPFRIGDFLSEVANENPEQFRRAQVIIYDGDRPKEENLLFDSKSLKLTEGIVQSSKNPFRRTANVTVAGTLWTVTLDATKDFEIYTSQSFPASILILGTIISFLIYSILRFSTRLRSQLQLELEQREASQREILRARFEAEKANRAKTLFLANMSHEIRTPLGVIVGFSDLVLEKRDLSEEIRNHLRVIKRNAQQLVTLVGEVLDLSKIEASKLDVEAIRFSLPDVLQEIISSLEIRAKEKQIDLILDLSQKIPECIVTDPTKFRQILVNLIGNAIKFTSHGYVKVSPRLLSAPTKGTPIELEFLIEDTGIGISPENSKKLFQAFSQGDASMSRKYGGTGLGLVLSKKLAHLLQGDVRLVRSEVSTGSVFSFQLKAGSFEGFWEPQTKQDEFPNREKESAPKPLAGCKILLVEDAIDNQILFSTYLRSSGAHFDVASDGAEAINKISHNNYDLVLMDIQMPNMDGHEATARLRMNHFDKPIIALTAHALQEERSRALENGFCDYLTKPVSRKDLIDKILEHLNSDQSQSQNH